MTNREAPPAAAGAVYYDTATVARLANYERATLRNYVYLATLTKKERVKGHLQDPPDGMPRPVKDPRSGRLRWPGEQVDRWIEERKRNGIQPSLVDDA